MATITAIAETSEVRIIAAMAGITVGGNGGTASDRSLMTGDTGRPSMSIAQRETGLYTVIKLPRLPGGRVVTIGALITETTSMGIIAGVAGKTIGFCIVKCRRRVALVTCDIRVCTDQWKTQKVMVEP